MTANLPESCRQLIDLQRGVLARWQAPAVELKPTTIRLAAAQRPLAAAATWRLRDLLRDAEPRCRVVGRRAAGRPAGDPEPSDRSRVGRADQHTKRGHPRDGSPQQARRARSREYACTDRSGWQRRGIPPVTPPRTRIEETVLDLTQTAKTIDGAFGWLCQACGSRLTTPELSAHRLSQRPKVRWRAILLSALDDIGDGAHSVLEVRYVRDVERPHGLPAGQAPGQGDQEFGPHLPGQPGRPLPDMHRT